MIHAKSMDIVIDKFISEAGKARNFKLVLGYQWILNAAESSEGLDILEAFMFEKAKGF